MSQTHRFARDTVDRIGRAVEALPDEDIAALEAELLAANAIFFAGAGRSRLAIKFFAMRAMQIGLKCHIVGEVCTPSIRKGDLLVVASGSGETPGMIAIANKAQQAGARLALVTESSVSTLADLADVTVAVQVPHAAPGDEIATAVPAGNYVELAIVVILDALICDLMQRTDTPLSTLHYNHANLE